MKISTKISSLESSGIRKMYDRARNDSINLGIGMPYCNTPDNIKDAAFEAIKNNKTFYTSNLGMIELRDAIAERYNKCHDKTISASNILITVGVAEAIFLSLFSLLECGDEVLLPDPGYMGYSLPVQMIGCKVNRYPLLFENQFAVRSEDVIGRITERTKVLILNSPGNPTGGVNSDSEIKQICYFCSQKGITIISDEVYANLNYSVNDFYSVSHYMSLDETMILNGVSKEFGMTGWRVGWIISSVENIKELVKVHQVMASCSSSISQCAAIDAIRSDNKDVVKLLEINKELMGNMLSNISNIRYFIPKGGLYYFVDFSFFGDDNVLAMKILEEANVITIPGSAFGTLGRGFLRLSFGARPEEIKTGMAKIKNILENF
jgi:aspartate/methionine/tyrosine aminotransferase